MADIPQVKKSKKVTSVDVARLAGVSQATVSRTLNHDPKLSPVLRERVEKAAEQLGYAPNLLARSLTGAKTHIIGLVFVMATPFYYQVITGLTERLQKLGYQALLFSVQGSEDIDAVLTRICQYQLDGIVITGAKTDSNIFFECKKRNIPAVLYGRSISSSLVSSVSCNNRKGGEDAAAFLIQKGHRKLACIYADLSTSTSLDRLNGFTACLDTQKGVEYALQQGGYSYESGGQATRQLFQRGAAPTAIFCLNMELAMGCIDALRYDLGLRVPEDVSVIGFDDSPLASGRAYHISTVVQPLEQMLDACVAMLLKQLSQEGMENQQIVLDGELVVRKSTEICRREGK